MQQLLIYFFISCVINKKKRVHLDRMAIYNCKSMGYACTNFALLRTNVPMSKSDRRTYCFRPFRARIVCALNVLIHSVL